MSKQLPTRKHPRLKGVDYSENRYYFVTVCASVRAENIFCAIQGSPPQTSLTPVGEIARRCMEELPTHIEGLTIDSYCIMPDHIHVIFAIRRPPYMAALQNRSKQILPKAIQQYKAAVSRQLQIHGLWQAGFYDHIIRNDIDLQATREYIQNNPLKWILDKIEENRKEETGHET